MEQMYRQFISYSCSLASGIPLYKLERYIGCLPISYACLSYGPHKHNRIPTYSMSSWQYAFEEEDCNYSHFSHDKKRSGGHKIASPHLKKFILALRSPKHCHLLGSCYSKVSCQTLNRRKPAYPILASVTPAVSTGLVWDLYPFLEGWWYVHYVPLSFCLPFCCKRNIPTGTRQGMCHRL